MAVGETAPMKPDFTGTYVLNREVCTLSPGASSIVAAELHLVHIEPKFSCSARFISADNKMEFTFERFTDGREVAINEGETSRWYWDGKAIVSEDPFGSGGIMIWRYELVANGSRLRATEQIRSAAHNQNNVWEFERR